MSGPDRPGLSGFTYPTNGGHLEIDESLCIVFRRHRSDGTEIVFTVTNVTDMIAGLQLTKEIRDVIEADVNGVLG